MGFTFELICESMGLKMEVAMGKRYSPDFLDKAYGFISRGETCRSVARRMGTSASFAIRLKRRVLETGQIGFGPQGRPCGKGKLDPFRNYLTGRMDAEPDITMPELAAKLEEVHNIIVHPSSLSRYLIKIGYSYKKRVDRVGTRQNEGSKSPS